MAAFNGLGRRSSAHAPVDELSTAGYGLLAVVLGVTVAAGQGEIASLGISLYLNADVPGPTLVQVKDDVARTFQDAGVRVIWRTRFPAPTERSPGVELTLIVLPRAMTERAGRSTELGIALRAHDGGVAYVFYDRVRDVASRYHVSLATVLGLALTHELGHLLLPDSSHANAGIMQGNWDQAAFQELRHASLVFTPSEAEQIRGRCR